MGEGRGLKQKKEEKMRREERGLRSGGDYNIIDKFFVLLFCFTFSFFSVFILLYFTLFFLVMS